ERRGDFQADPVAGRRNAGHGVSHRRQRLAWHAVLRHHAACRAPDRQPRPARGRRDRRRQRLAAVLAGDAAPSPTHHAGGRTVLDDRDVRRLPAHLRPDARRTVQQHPRLRDLRLRDRHAGGQARARRLDLAFPLPVPPRGHRVPALVHPAERLTMAVRYGGPLKRAVTFQIPLVLMVGVTLFPFYWMVITSIRPDPELYNV